MSEFLPPANCGTGRRKASANGAWPAPSDRQFTYKPLPSTALHTEFEPIAGAVDDRALHRATLSLRGIAPRLARTRRG
ncbi:hypothetical protein EGY31_17850 [Burkholderia multivorans]|nr:hypothetical protein EGY31_17850 [Burkholderia multivorans]